MNTYLLLYRVTVLSNPSHSPGVAFSVHGDPTSLRATLVLNTLSGIALFIILIFRGWRIKKHLVFGHHGIFGGVRFFVFLVVLFILQMVLLTSSSILVKEIDN